MKAAYKPNREKGIKIVEVPIPEIAANAEWSYIKIKGETLTLTLIDFLK
jgi:hypothetical protein